MFFKATAIAALAAAPSVSAAGCYPAWQSGGSYVAGSMVSATITVVTTSGSGDSATTTTTYVKKNFKCTFGSEPSLSHCPNYDPAGVSSSVAWSEQGVCDGNAAITTPSPTTKPTYAQWTRAGCPKTWASGHEYEPGDLAEVDGVVYKCSEAEFVNIWCGQDGYKPGDSEYWNTAWTRLGSCDGTISPTTSPIYSQITDAGGCPDDFSDSAEYEAGDSVTVNGLVYKCRSWPNSGWCGRAGYEPGGAESGEAWTLVGYCDGTISPTTSPNFDSMTDVGGCPDPYDSSGTYEKGDRVSVGGNGVESIVFQCSTSEHDWQYCNQYEPGHWSKLGWKIEGYCEGTMSPTTSPSWDALDDHDGCPEEYNSDNDYEASDKVSVPVNNDESVVYQCSSDIHQYKYCNEFEPGNEYNLGWTLIAHCDGTMSPTTSPNFEKLSEVGDGCPKTYDAETDYEAGDRVTVPVSDDPSRSIVYSCKAWPSGAYCNAGPNFSPESVNVNMGWTLEGYCDGTISPTASPTVYPDPRCKWFNGTKAVTITTWSAGSASSYVAGTRVRRERQIYKCKPYPYSLWCKQAAYEPEETSVWQEAWVKAGECQDPTASTSSPSVSPTRNPTKAPTKRPTKAPTNQPAAA